MVYIVHIHRSERFERLAVERFWLNCIFVLFCLCWYTCVCECIACVFNEYYSYMCKHVIICVCVCICEFVFLYLCVCICVLVCLYLCVCVWQKSETRCRVIVGWGLTRPCRVEIHRLGDWSLHQQPWSTTCHLSNHHSPHPPHRLRPGVSFFLSFLVCWTSPNNIRLCKADLLTRWREG